MNFDVWGCVEILPYMGLLEVWYWSNGTFLPLVCLLGVPFLLITSSCPILCLCSLLFLLCTIARWLMMMGTIPWNATKTICFSSLFSDKLNTNVIFSADVCKRIDKTFFKLFPYLTDHYPFSWHQWWWLSSSTATPLNTKAKSAFVRYWYK